MNTPYREKDNTSHIESFTDKGNFLHNLLDIYLDITLKRFGKRHV